MKESANSMTNIEDVTDNEHKRMSAMLFGRYGRLAPIQLADSELQLGADPM
jgi:hypothetical protein